MITAVGAFSSFSVPCRGKSGARPAGTALLVSNAVLGRPCSQKVLPPLALNHAFESALSRKTTISTGMTKPSR